MAAARMTRQSPPNRSCSALKVFALCALVMMPALTHAAPPRGERVSKFYDMFKSAEMLEHYIRGCGDDERFYDEYSQLFHLRPIANVVNALPETARRAVKARLAKVVRKHEGAMAFDVEASDWDMDLRRERHENASHHGKTGIFVFIFRKVLDWIYGRDFLEQALEAGKERRRIQARLKELGITEEYSSEELEKIVRSNRNREKPFKGTPFDPFNIAVWPKFDTVAEEADPTIKELLDKSKGTSDSQEEVKEGSGLSQLPMEKLSSQGTLQEPSGDLQGAIKEESNSQAKSNRSAIGSV